MLQDKWKGIKCLFCDEYELVHISDKDWFLCLTCGLDFELSKNKGEQNA
jgi:transcription elongation factor Elf1